MATIEKRFNYIATTEDKEIDSRELYNKILELKDTKHVNWNPNTGESIAYVRNTTLLLLEDDSIAKRQFQITGEKMYVEGLIKTLPLELEARGIKLKLEDIN